jgi:hypothetical protein
MINIDYILVNAQIVIIIIILPPVYGNWSTTATMTLYNISRIIFLAHESSDQLSNSTPCICHPPVGTSGQPNHALLRIMVEVKEAMTQHEESLPTFDGVTSQTKSHKLRGKKLHSLCFWS